MALSSCYEQVATIHLINNVGDTENHSQIVILNLGITDYLEATTVCKQVVYRLKGQCVSMEAVEF